MNPYNHQASKLLDGNRPDNYMQGGGANRGAPLNYPGGGGRQQQYSQPNQSGYLGQQGSGYPQQGSGYPGRSQGSGYPSQSQGSVYPSGQQGGGYPGAQGGGYPPQQGGGGYPSQGAGGYQGGGGYGGGGGGAPAGIRPEIWNWFQAVDQDKSGQISANELQSALTNGNWTPFNTDTCKMMIGMFDRDYSGTISVQEFQDLWKYITDWKATFDKYDRDRSGTIQPNELNSAFRDFGYNLSPQFTQICTRRFDKANRGGIGFDDFIYCSVMLHNFTEAFKAKDAQRQGVVQFRYEEFLQIVMEQVMRKLN